MQKSIRKYFKNINKLYYIISFLILLLIIIMIFNGMNNGYESLVANKSNYEYAVTIPKIENKKEEKKIRNKIDEEIRNFKKTVKKNELDQKNSGSKFKFTIDYYSDVYETGILYEVKYVIFLGNRKWNEKNEEYFVEAKTGKRLSEIFINIKDSKYENRICKLIDNDIYNRNELVLKENDKKKITCDLTRYKIKEDGIEFTLENNIKSFVPYTRVKDYLRDEKLREKYNNVGFSNRNLELIKNKKLVAFTFDDGPNPKTTGWLLDQLERLDSKVTFFVVGSRVKMFPDLIKREALEGHEVANHTTNHKNLFKLDRDSILYEIHDTSNEIEKVTGKYPVSFRAPYGNVNLDIRVLGELNSILWSLDSTDWKLKDKDEIKDKVVSEIGDGDIVLFHDLYYASVEGAIMAIEELKQQGYEFVTVEELSKLRNINFDNTRDYYSFSK